jgi:hypothetical protein
MYTYLNYIRKAVGRLEVSVGQTGNLPKLGAVIGGNRSENSGDWPLALKHCEEAHIDPSALFEATLTDAPTPTYAGLS